MANLFTFPLLAGIHLIFVGSLKSSEQDNDVNCPYLSKRGLKEDI